MKTLQEELDEEMITLDDVEVCPRDHTLLVEETVGEGKKQLVCPTCKDIWS